MRPPLTLTERVMLVVRQRFNAVDAGDRIAALNKRPIKNTMAAGDDILRFLLFFAYGSGPYIQNDIVKVILGKGEPIASGKNRQGI